MAKIAWRGLTLSILLLALPLGASAQDAATVLQPTAEALRVGEVRTLRLVASGSGYAPRSEAGDTQAASPDTTAAAGTVDPSSPMFVPPPPAPKRSYYRIVSQVQSLDLAAQSLSIEQVRAESSAPDAVRSAPEVTSIDAGADWSERHRYWLTPHGFVAGALAGDAQVGTETVSGVEYRVVSLTVDGGHEVRGYVDADDRLVRVRTTVEDADGGTTDVIESFFDWGDRGELTFPSTLIRKENGELAEVLVVKELDAATAG